MALQEINFSVRDGLRLRVRCHPAPGSSRRPLICLASIIGNARDFDPLGMALSGHGTSRRSVYALDARGHGSSEWDPVWSNYTELQDCEDALDLLTLLGLTGAAILGSGRGGIVAMIMGLLRPSALGAVVLNDIGPSIEPDGYVRMMSQVGRLPTPSTWADATQLMRRLYADRYPRLTTGEWQDLARAAFLEKDGRPAPGYDPAISRTHSLSRGTAEVPSLWAPFLALSHVPVLCLRGELSDVLSSQTVARMADQHPALASATIPREGHAPRLRDTASIDLIASFLEQTDAMTGQSPRTLKAVA